MNLDKINGLGPKTIEKLSLKKIESINDLIFFYPITYSNYENNTNSIRIVITGTIISSINTFKTKSNLSISTFTIKYNNQKFKITAYNQKHLFFNFKKDNLVTVYCKNDFKNQVLLLEKIVLGKSDKNIFPIYSNIKSISNSQISNLILKGIEISELDVKTKKALISINNPCDLDQLSESIYYLKYIEFEKFYLKLKQIKEKQSINDINYIKTLDRNDLKIFSQKLPFAYTNSQKDVINSIFNDFLQDKVSNTIVIGDVSSGKTIVALSLCFCMINQGYKVVFMAPTEILANQIESEMNKYLDSDLVLKLTSSTTKTQKKVLLKKLQSDKPYIIVGTHALIEDDVIFSNLGLIIIDEQQRFGVKQRQKIIDKSSIAEVLYLTATPIPRSLSHALFGITQTRHLTEKPLKSIVKTSITESFDQVISLIKKHVDNKRQVFIITPLVERNEDSDLFDAKTVKKELQKKFSDFNVDIVTGNMKSKVKQKIMTDVNDKKVDILVATSILEVGIDVKNATCIVVLNAERFGLSQLHQLRGRIGRNEYSNDCLLYSDAKNPTSISRLSNMLKFNNGYELAKMDLQSRGSGDVLGIKQSGNPDFKIFNIMFDMDIVEEVIKNNS